MYCKRGEKLPKGLLSVSTDNFQMDFLSGDECTYSSHLHVNIWWALLAKTNPIYIKMFYLVPIFFFQYGAEWKRGHNDCVGNCNIEYCRVLSITSSWQQLFVTGALMKVLIGATSCADQILCLSFKGLQIQASFSPQTLKTSSL